MKERTASVHLQRDGRVFVDRYTHTANGFLIADGLPVVLAGFDDACVVGDALIVALHASNQRPLPERDLRANPPDREFLAWLGVKSYGRYMRGVRSLGIDAHFDEVIREITITPESNDGPRGGFSPISEERFSIMFESAEQLGRAVQAAMAKATV